MSAPVPRHELTLDLPAAHRGVRVARHLVRRFARMEGVTDRDLEPLTLVVSELLANAIDHGGGNAALDDDEVDSGARMRLRCVIRADEWEIAVTDQGGGDPEVVRALFGLNGMPDLEDERGRGLFLMATMVDRIVVERSADGCGLTILATKRHG